MNNFDLTLPQCPTTDKPYQSDLVKQKHVIMVGVTLKGGWNSSSGQDVQTWLQRKDIQGRIPRFSK